jgi:hypothetical protein
MSLKQVYSEIAAESPGVDFYVRAGYVTPDRKSVDTSQALDPASALQERLAPDILGQESIDGQTLIIVDKSNPHSLTDVMISVFGSDKPVISFADASNETRQKVLEWMLGFATYVTTDEVNSSFDLTDGFMRIGINIDHETQDRGGLQGMRTLHPHCLCFSKLGETSPVHTLDLNARDDLLSIVDPLAHVGPRIIRDHFQAGSFPDSIYETFEVNDEGDEEKVMPFAFNMRLKDSWGTLLQPIMGQAFADLDTTMQRIYLDIRTAVTGTDPGHKLETWQRYSVLDPDSAARNIDALPHLSNESRDSLKLMASSLRTISPEVMNRLRVARAAGKVSFAEKILAYAGLAYGLTLYSPGTIGEMRDKDGWRGNAYVAVQPFLRRPPGVAGLNFDSEGHLFKIERHRGAKPMSLGEEVLRQTFQKGFVESLGLRC